MSPLQMVPDHICPALSHHVYHVMNAMRGAETPNGLMSSMFLYLCLGSPPNHHHPFSLLFPLPHPSR